MKKLIPAVLAVLLLASCTAPGAETTPTPVPAPTEIVTPTPTAEPTTTPEPTPAPGSWVRLGPDETPPPGAWVKHYFEYNYDEESEGYISEDVTEYMVSTVTWSFDEDTKTLTFSGEGSLPDGVLAEDLSYGLPMEVLRFPWDNLKDSATTVILEEGIIRIPERAFEGFVNLTAVKLPSTLKIIEFAAFASCAFSEIDLPDGLEEVGSHVFASCGELLHCEIPASVRSLSGNLFRECRKLETVTLMKAFLLSMTSVLPSVTA